MYDTRTPFQRCQLALHCKVFSTALLLPQTTLAINCNALHGMHNPFNVLQRVLGLSDLIMIMIMISITIDIMHVGATTVAT